MFPVAQPAIMSGTCGNRHREDRSPPREVLSAVHGRPFGPGWMRVGPLVPRQVIPEIQLPPEPGLRWNIRYRLQRRVIEIRDAELVLRPYAAGRSSGSSWCAAPSAVLISSGASPAGLRAG